MSHSLRENIFSIIIDKTTDISKSKCLAVVCRYFDGELGQVRDRFLTLIEFTQFDAKHMFAVLKKFVQDIVTLLALRRTTRQ